MEELSTQAAADLLDYKKRREQARRESIVRIARQSEELGDYDKFTPPKE